MHTSALTDEKILKLTPADRWAWAALATYTRQHGNKGNLVTDPQNPFLACIFGCDKTSVLDTIKRLPNVLIENIPNCNAEISLQFTHWNKYAEDNSLERVRKHRLAAKSALNVTPKKRKEKSRGEENTPPLPPPGEGANASETDSSAVKTPALEPETAAFALAAESNKRTRKRRTQREPGTALEYAEVWRKESWPSVRRFVALYNELSPVEWPKAEILDDARIEKIRFYLKQFPKQEFWERVYSNARESNLCRAYHNAGLEWILQRGQDHFENSVKIYEKKFDRIFNK